MTSRRRNLFVILLMLGLLIASGVVIAAKETRLGLDLKGGVELVYQGEPTPQTEVTPEAVDRSIDIIRERVDQLGVAEPEIQRLGSDQISVGLPGIKDLERAKRQVGTTAQLYFYDWEKNVIGDPQTPLPGLHAAVTKASKRQPAVDADNTTGRQYYLFNSKKQLEAGPDGLRTDLLSQFGGRVPKGYEVLSVPAGTLVVKAERPPNFPDDRPFDRYFLLKDEPELKGTDIRNPEQNYDQFTNEPIVTFEFNERGRDQFKTVTKRLAERGQASQVPGQPAEGSFQTFAIVLDREVVSRPFIDYRENPEGIDGRTGAQISGGFKLQEAQDLADVLKTGALPITLKPISETKVSATLGKQALREGLIAGAVGFLLVLLFLLAFYRLLGVIAGMALFMYAILFFGLIKLIPITLTLPGIAGLILTIGVAADTNIVIFERIKEELRSGKSTLAAISTGYTRGIATIIDANVVTLITAFILFVLATAGIKGFAFTLGVGTLVSLFTAVVFTQAVLGTMGRSRILRSPAMLGVRKKRQRWRFDFMGRSKLFFAISGAILIVGSIAFSTLGFNFGIDFESGTRVTSAVNRDVGVEDVRDAISSLGLDDAKIQEVENPEVGDNVVQISTSELGPGEVQKLETALDDAFGVPTDGFSSESVGPTFGETVARSAAIAIVSSLLLIMVYVSLRFEPKFAVPVVIALFHDILITAGIYSLTGREVTSSTVAALLTILGFSLYDTVIVFDRIRENAPRMPRAAFSQIVNRSMSEVLTRSLATSFCTLLPVTALMLFGGTTLKDFAFALLVGIGSGTYSSIFIAGPVLTAWKEREPGYAQRRKRLIAEHGFVPAFADMEGMATPDADTDEEPSEETTKARRRQARAAGAARRAAESGGDREPATSQDPGPGPEPAASPGEEVLTAAPAGNGQVDGDGQLGGEAEVDGDTGVEGDAEVVGNAGEGEAQQPAAVAGRGDQSGATQRDGRAERKKQRARQKSRRKHGRSR